MLQNRLSTVKSGITIKRIAGFARWIFTYLPIWFFYQISFGRFGFRSIVHKPLRLDGKKRIFIGYGCNVGYKSWLAAMPLTGNLPELVIEDGCAIGNFNHIYATKSVILHKNVLTADKVYISDNLHGYDDVETPIQKQKIIQNRTVEIGEGSWIGENVCVLGAKIGKHCVIGANSVVNKDIPDYCVAVGAPAKVIKRYDCDTNTWQKTDAEKADKESLGGVISALSYVQHKPSFKEFHFSDKIKSPILITPQYIELGEYVYIGHHARIQGISEYQGTIFNPRIIFLRGSSAQQNLHLTCANLVTIGRNTAIAANVTITDIHHPYTDENLPIEQQMIEVKEVIIGDDSKIYNNAVILPGVHIGKHVTIGANSVVTHDIPDFCVAVGNPAKIVKKYDFKKKVWIRV